MGFQLLSLRSVRILWRDPFNCQGLHWNLVLNICLLNEKMNIQGNYQCKDKDEEAEGKTLAGLPAVRLLCISRNHQCSQHTFN